MVSKALGVGQNFFTAYHPQTDGQMKCKNQTLEQYFRIYCNYRQDNNWASLLPTVSFAYNNERSASTGRTPFCVNYGYHLRLGIDAADADRVPAVQKYLLKLKEAQEVAKKQLEEVPETQTKYYNRKRQEVHEFEEGELVW